MYTDHPFAEFVLIPGKGKNGSRSLAMDEAYHSMNMMLTDGRNTSIRDAEKQARAMLDLHTKNKYGVAA